ncbi:thiamine-phosphate kinase [Crenobacter cavernae]|uniref:Thiamine-monophosphate kinase n=1 Tax=Crenobacter cavernae TaxID=2290923 RepID=A0ABY0FAS6_9NEIS|nr:thiamine-phosphate kinase [Crenobacter cavernae]RXZ42755.1 thiamine-phosphate kinase [Crenobacter cavernae]
MNEFELIHRYFDRPAQNAVLGVGDDAAIVRPTPGFDLFVSVDMLVEGRHFLAGVDAAALGHKTLAVNLSDMAAMGATPRWVVLSVALPHNDEAWVAGLADGFFALADRYKVGVIGGDTTRGPLTLSVTVFGEAPAGRALRRDAAEVGDDVWVSGALGLGAMALREKLNGDLILPADVFTAGIERLEKPVPRVELGQGLLGLAHAAIDVSDGWFADFGHILARSNKGAELWFDALPTHPWLAERRAVYPELIAAGGDDYELAFTAAVSNREQIVALGASLGVAVTRVGRVLAPEEGVTLVDVAGKPVKLKRAGYDHFA